MYMIELFIFLFLLFNPVLSLNIYCSRHDACRNYAITNSANIYCGGGERTCRNIHMVCDTKSCSVTTQGNGHDAFQNSEIDARKITAQYKFELKCQANGFRDCKSIIIWCPLSKAPCNCISCPNTVTMKCVKNNGNCNSISSAKVEYYDIPIPTTMSPVTIPPTTTTTPTTTINYKYIYKPAETIHKKTVIIPIKYPSNFYKVYVGHIDIHLDGYGELKFKYLDNTLDVFKTKGNGGLRFFNPLKNAWNNKIYNSQSTPEYLSSQINMLSNVRKSYYIDCLNTIGTNIWEWKTLSTGLKEIIITENSNWAGWKNLIIYTNIIPATTTTTMSPVTIPPTTPITKIIYNYKNITNYFNKSITTYTNKTRYNYVNKTRYNYVNKTRYGYIYKVKYYYINKTTDAKMGKNTLKINNEEFYFYNGITMILVGVIIILLIYIFCNNMNCDTIEDMIYIYDTICWVKNICCRIKKYGDKIESEKKNKKKNKNKKKKKNKKNTINDMDLNFEDIYIDDIEEINHDMNENGGNIKISIQNINGVEKKSVVL